MTESNALPMPSHPAGSRRHYQTDGRERVLLVLALGLGFLTADLCLAMWYGVPALGSRCWYCSGKEHCCGMPGRGPGFRRRQSGGRAWA